MIQFTQGFGAIGLNILAIGNLRYLNEGGHIQVSICIHFIHITCIHFIHITQDMYKNRQKLYMSNFSILGLTLRPCASASLRFIS